LSNGRGMDTQGLKQRIHVRIYGNIVERWRQCFDRRRTLAEQRFVEADHEGVLIRVACFAEDSVITGRDIAASLPRSSLPPTFSNTPSEALYDLPLKDATARNTSDFQRRYCERLLLRAGGEMKKAVALSQYS